MIGIIIGLELIEDILLFDVSRNILLTGDGTDTGGELLNSSVVDAFV